MVDVASAGVIERAAWVPEPLRTHPLDRPFAWALVKLDGADTPLLHALDCGSADRAQPGARVRIRWAAETTGHLPTSSASSSHEACGRQIRSGNEHDPVQFMSHHTAVEYKIPEPSSLSVHFGERARKGAHHRSSVPAVLEGLHAAARLLPVVRGRDDGGRRGRGRRPQGTVTTFSVITPLQYQGQQETEDYVQGTILLDGADTTIMVMRMDGIPIADMRMGMRVRGGVAAGSEAVRLGDRVGQPRHGARRCGRAMGTNRRARPHPGTDRGAHSVMRDVAIVAFAQAPLEQPRRSDRDAHAAADDHRGARPRSG